MQGSGAESCENVVSLGDAWIVGAAEFDLSELNDALVALGLRVRALAVGDETPPDASAPDVVFLCAAGPPDRPAQLRANPALDGVPIVMVVRPETEPSRIAWAIECGADDVLRIPAQPMELMARGRSALRMRARALESKRANARVAELTAQVERLTVRDGLTGLYNRSHLGPRLGEEIDRARRYGTHLSLVAADIDALRSTNDTHGRAVGDAVLRGVSSVLARAARRSDLVGRIGDDEFALITPSTPLAGACVLAERMRSQIAALPMRPSVRVTASFGVAALVVGARAPAVDSAAELLERAHTALHRAKRSGRNRVTFDGV